MGFLFYFMVATNLGYYTLEQVKELIDKGNTFAIYESMSKGRRFLVRDQRWNLSSIQLCRPKEDRLPWKIVEGKGITGGSIVFDSTKQGVEDLHPEKWNGGKQIITYTQYTNW